MAGKTIKRIILMALVITIVLSLASQGFALGNKKMLEAWYMNVRIISNGQEVFAETEPFIVNNKVYVPVRMIADIFNKNVEWDQANYTVSITDKPDAYTSSLMTQLYIKDIEMAQLRERIEELEDNAGSSGTIDIDDLEDDLNHDYDEYKDIEFDIALSGTKNNITVKINFDLDDYETEWDDLTTSNVKSYLQDICDDILDEFEDADIYGYFKDTSGSTSSKLHEFDTSSKGTVVFDDSDSHVDFDDLEDDMDDFCYDYFNDIRLSLELDGDEDDITYTIYIDYEEYEDEWDDLDDEEIEWLMKDVYDEIEDEFEDADIVGYIVDESDDDDTMARYDPDRSTEFYRYK